MVDGAGVGCCADSVSWVNSRLFSDNNVLTKPNSGTKKIKYLEENVGALNVELSKEEVKQIRDEIEAVEVKGERYPPFFAAYSFADTPELDGDL